MTSPIRIGIVGTGGMANWHARQFLATGRCEIVAACDVDEARAAAFAKTHGAAQVFTDYRVMIERGEIEAISIVTPNDMHHPVTMAALAAGLHVLCEKPLALSLADAEEMVTTAHATGVIHVVNFTHRNTPCFTLARQIIEAGHIGEIYHVQCTYLQDWLLRRARQPNPGPPPWRFDRRVAGSGQLGDLGSHVLDLLYGMVGDVRSVSASLPSFLQLHDATFAPADISDDLAALQLTFDNGAVGQVLTSRVATGMGDAIALQVYGREGALQADDTHRNELRVCSGALGLDRRVWSTLTIAENEVEPNPVQLFVEGIANGKQPAMSFDDGLRVQRVMVAALESAEHGTQVRVAAEA